MAAAQTAVICRCDRGLLDYSTPGGTLLTGWSVGTDALGGLAEHRAGHRRHHHHRRRGKPRDGRGRLVSIFLELCSSSSFSPICTQAVCGGRPEVDTGCMGFLIRISKWQGCLEPCERHPPPFFSCFSLGTNGQPNVPQPHRYSYLFLAGFCIFSLSLGRQGAGSSVFFFMLLILCGFFCSRAQLLAIAFCSLITRDGDHY
jgi:hypothetical protein